MRASIVGIGESGLQREGQPLERCDVNPVRPRKTAGCRCGARGWASNPQMDVADIVPKGIVNRRLNEAPAAVIRAGDVGPRRLPRDIDGPVGAVDRQRGLGGVRLGGWRNPGGEGIGGQGALARDENESDREGKGKGGPSHVFLRDTWATPAGPPFPSRPSPDNV